MKNYKQYDLHIHSNFQSLTREERNAIYVNFDNYYKDSWSKRIPIQYYNEELTHYVMCESDVIYMGSITPVTKFYQSFNV